MEEQDVENYEKLHVDYDKLMAEYKELRNNNGSNEEISKKRSQLDEKQKEITEIFSKMIDKEQ